MHNFAIFNIRRKWQDPEILIVIRVYNEKLGHILEPLVAKYRPDLFARFRDIAEKQVPANLKPIVVELVATKHLPHSFMLLLATLRVCFGSVNCFTS